MNGYLPEVLARQWVQDRVAEAEAWNRARAAREYSRATRRPAPASPSRAGATARATVVRALRAASGALLAGADRLDRPGVVLAVVGGRCADAVVGGRCAEAVAGRGPSRFSRI